MKKIWLAFGVVIILIAVMVGYLVVRTRISTAPIKTGITSKSTPASGAPSSIAPTPKSTYFFPMTNFDSRIQYRWFGKYVNATDKVPDCGTVFVGYHDGDDLETTAIEKTTDVPVYAVSDGTIRLVQSVSGYGGLLIMQANINGQDVTLNYGHIRLSSVKLKVGDSVKAGQQLAVLGTGCSAETDGERKHLHFAIHKGTAVNVAGYVQTQAALLNWIDPKAFLDPLKPNSPS